MHCEKRVFWNNFLDLRNDVYVLSTIRYKPGVLEHRDFVPDPTMAVIIVITRDVLPYCKRLEGYKIAFPSYKK